MKMSLAPTQGLQPALPRWCSGSQSNASYSAGHGTMASRIWLAQERFWEEGGMHNWVGVRRLAGGPAQGW